jgi:hypothetical protein
MSSPFNVVKVEQLRVSGVPIDFGKTYNSGDMLKWDSSNHVAIPVVSGDAASTVAAAAFLGIAIDTQPITSLNQNLPAPRMSVVTRGLVELVVADSATYYPGDYVTFAADPQQVKKTSASAANAIAVCAPENFFAVASGTTTGITASAGVTKLKFYLKPQFTGLTSF